MRINPKTILVCVILFVGVFIILTAVRANNSPIVRSIADHVSTNTSAITDAEKYASTILEIGSNRNMHVVELNRSRPTLTQKDFQTPNTIYILKSDFELAEHITMPANCILEFDGGSLRGGTIIGNNTSIKPADYAIFNDCIVKNFNLPYVDPRWVGAIPDYKEQDNSGTDNSVYFQRAYDNILVYHPGIDMLVIGKYLISKTVKFRMHCHLRGVHNNTRGLVMRNLQKENGSSNSLIAIGNCVAFLVVGDESRERTWADLSIERIKFLGLSKSKSIAIQYEAAGSPTRPATIERCEASNLLYFLFSKAKENTTLGNLTVRENNIYNCSKAIYSVSEPAQNMGMTALKIENNVIEHNGKQCIHLTKCFGPIIIDNNILEGQSNPIYITSTYPSETSYVITNNYFEQPGNDDKKIHIDGVIRTEGKRFDYASFLTSVSIYGNTSPYGLAVELNGVRVRRLDRIDTPSMWPSNYSVFSRCLFENIDISDVQVSQLSEWNFSTDYPSSMINRKDSIIGDAGSDLLSFEDVRGNAKTNKSTEVVVAMNEDQGKNNLMICKIRPRFTPEYKRVILNYSINKEAFSFGAAFPREIPYYAILVYQKGVKVRGGNYSFSFNAYNEGTSIEMSNITVYKSVDGALFKYPHIMLQYSKN